LQELLSDVSEETFTVYSADGVMRDEQGEHVDREAIAGVMALIRADTYTSAAVVVQTAGWFTLS
jgi:hypothetical protein